MPRKNTRIMYHYMHNSSNCKPWEFYTLLVITYKLSFKYMQKLVLSRDQLGEINCLLQKLANFYVFFHNFHYLYYSFHPIQEFLIIWYQFSNFIFIDFICRFCLVGLCECIIFTLIISLDCFVNRTCQYP